MTEQTQIFLYVTYTFIYFQQLVLMCADKILWRKVAGRRNQYKEGSNTQPLMEQQQHQQWACCLSSCNPCWDPGCGQQLSLAHACRPSSVLPQQLRPCQKCHLSAISPAHSAAGTGHLLLSKRGGGQNTQVFFLTGWGSWICSPEGLMKPQGQDEVWGGSRHLQGMKCRRQEVRPRRMSPSPLCIRSLLAIFHIPLE